MRFFVPVLMALLLIACGEEVSKDDALAYGAFIKEKHDLLGRAIILQGRLIESFNMNKDILDDTKFMDAEGHLETLLDKIGSVESIEAARLPATGPGIEALHSHFADAVYFLNECKRAVDDSAYASISHAEAAWDRARVSFGTFTRDLVAATTGEALPEIKPRDLSEPEVGERMRVYPSP